MAGPQYDGGVAVITPNYRTHGRAPHGVVQDPGGYQFQDFRQQGSTYFGSQSSIDSNRSNESFQSIGKS